MDGGASCGAASPPECPSPAPNKQDQLFACQNRWQQYYNVCLCLGRMQQRPYAPLARSILLTFPGFLSCHLHSVSTPQPTVQQHTHPATATGEHQWSTHETVKADTQNTMQAYVMWFWRLLALHNTAVQMGQGARLSPGFVALPAFTAALAPTSTCTRMAKDVVMNKTMG